METTQIKVDPGNPATWPKGRVDAARVDSTSARALTRQQASDDAVAMQDAAKYARRVRQRLGLTQQELSQRIDVSLETIRNATGSKASEAQQGQLKRCCGYWIGGLRLPCVR